MIEPREGADRGRAPCDAPRLFSLNHFHLLLVWLLAGLAMSATAGPALADLELCNATSSRIGVAVGYQDPKGWATEGWWNIASQTCETLLKGKLGSRFYYVHAVDYDRGGEWGGTNMMCTADKVFTIRGVD